MPDNVWTYRARVVDVVDGDTLDVQVDLGFHMTRQIRLRLAGVDTAETYGVDHDSDEYARGQTHTQFVSRWVNSAEGAWPFLVQTDKRGKYGRYIAYLRRRSDGAVLNEDLKTEFDGVADE